MIKVFNPTKEEVWRNPKDAKEPYSCCCVVLGCLGYPGLLLGYSNVLGVSWGQPLANGCIHIGINTNAPGGCFAQQQVLRSLMMIALMVHLVDGRHTLDQIGDMPSGGYADCYVQRRSLG